MNDIYAEAKKTIAVDLDGVLHRYSGGWRDGAIYDIPSDGAVEMVERLVNHGYKVVVMTARENLDDVRAWLKANGFPELVVTNKKIPALVYLDDRAVRFTTCRDFANLYV